MAREETDRETFDSGVDTYHDQSAGFGFGGAFEERRERSFMRAPLSIAGAIIAAILIGAYLYFSDQNSDRWELRCTHGEALARRGLYFPWGTRGIADDAHGPLLLPEGVSCATVQLESLAELDRTLGALLLESAENRLQHGGDEALTQARQSVERARRLQGLTDEQRSRAEALLADMAYHEAREILRQVERSLIKARRKLERASSLGAGDRFRDLEEWHRFVQDATDLFSPADEDNTPPTTSEGEEDAAEPEPPTKAPAEPLATEIFL